MDDDLERWKRWTQELSWGKVVWWPRRDLQRLGVDTLNLLCAIGLPGVEDIDIDHCLKTIGEWTERVRDYTARMMHRFERAPSQFANSLPYFKALCLITVLQRDCGVQFNPLKRDLDAALEASDSFLFGIIQGNGGTCASLPVLYCGVAHRLGYPMFLVRAKGEGVEHLFVRWDDGQVRFNIEATAQGMSTPTDDHYRTGHRSLTPDIERRGHFLKPNNIEQTLAIFLAERAGHWHQAKEHQFAVESMSWAAALHPDNEFYLNTAKIYYNEWLQFWNQKKPPAFPDIHIVEVAHRRFLPTVPMQFEMETYGLEAMVCLLKDKNHDRNLWEPLRRGQRPVRVPVEAEVKVARDGGKSIRLLFERNPSRDAGDFANV